MKFKFSKTIPCGLYERFILPTIIWYSNFSLTKDNRETKFCGISIAWWYYRFDIRIMEKRHDQSVK